MGDKAPSVQLTNPDALRATFHLLGHLMWPEGGRWSSVEVRWAEGWYYLTAVNADQRLTLSAPTFADLDAIVEDLVRALGAFQAKYALVGRHDHDGRGMHNHPASDADHRHYTPEAGGGPPSAPAGFGLTPEHRPVGPAPEHDPSHAPTSGHHHDDPAAPGYVRMGLIALVRATRPGMHHHRPGNLGPAPDQPRDREVGEP